MDTLTMTEQYTLLMLNAIGNRTDFLAGQYTGGIILGGICELEEGGYIFVKNEKVFIKKIPEQGWSCGLFYNFQLYPEKKIKGWLEWYCCTATYKNIRPVVNQVLQSLERKGFIEIKRKRGWFKEKTAVVMNDAAAEAIRAYREALDRKSSTPEMIFCTQMLLLADVLQLYFPVGSRSRVRTLLAEYKKTAMWKKMDPYVSLIRNFNDQNAFYTGVM